MNHLINPRKRKRSHYSPDDSPELVFSPLAWLKLMFFLHAGNTEIGGFGISQQENLLYVEDLAIVSQRTTCVSVEFDDGAVADYFDRMVDRGTLPQQFMRIWVHTHPGDSAEPSITDEMTFDRVFGKCDWAVMFIIARSGEIYARLRVAGGPGVEVLIPTRVDWAAWPELACQGAEGLPDTIRIWAEEYVQRVQPIPLSFETRPSERSPGSPETEPVEPEWQEYLQELEMREEMQRWAAEQEVR